MEKRTETDQWPETKRKIVDSGIGLMRTRGFNATSLDEICSTAGVTKGGFFHYFKSKDDLAKAALARFADGKAWDLLEAPFRKLADPLQRVYGRLDFVADSMGGSARVTKGCLIGMLAMELSSTNPELRGVCRDFFTRIAEDVAQDLAEAKECYAPKAKFDTANLAVFYVTLVQGSIIMARAQEDNSVLLNNLDQFRDYLETLFGRAHRGARSSASI